MCRTSVGEAAVRSGSSVRRSGVIQSKGAGFGVSGAGGEERRDLGGGGAPCSDERIREGDDGCREDDADCRNSRDNKPRSRRVRTDSLSGYVCHKYQSEPSAEKACHRQKGGECNGIGTNCFNRGPLNQRKKEEGDGEGNECDTEVEREPFHDVVKIDPSLA